MKREREAVGRHRGAFPQDGEDGASRMGLRLLNGSSADSPRWRVGTLRSGGYPALESRCVLRWLSRTAPCEDMEAMGNTELSPAFAA